jgi:hypothetical protein
MTGAVTSPAIYRVQLLWHSQSPERSLPPRHLALTQQNLFRESCIPEGYTVHLILTLKNPPPRTSLWGSRRRHAAVCRASDKLILWRSVMVALLHAYCILTSRPRCEKWVAPYHTKILSASYQSRGNGHHRYLSLIASFCCSVIGCCISESLASSPLRRQ